jgi:trimeric autotransporter adhesin
VANYRVLEFIDFPGEISMRRFIKFFVLLLAALLLSISALAQQDIISTVIGGGPNDIPAIDANLNQPDAVAVDKSGDFYISAFGQNRVFEVNSKGVLTVLAGQGVQGFGGDGGPAASAFLNGPQGIAVDGAGNVYLADENNCVVRKVSKGTITTIAGQGGQCNFGGDGGKGTSAFLSFPIGVAVDSTGANLYIADRNNCVVRKLVLATDIITTFAGDHTCGYAGDNGPALSAELSSPDGVAVDGNENVFIADTNNSRIREVTKSNGKINTVGGDGTFGCTGDGNAATSAEISTVVQLTVDSGGTTVTFPDQACQKVRQFTVGKNMNTVAGTGNACFGICGDGGAATSAELDSPQGIATVTTNKVFLIADLNNERVREFTVGGNINGVAGNGSTTTPTLLNGIAPTGVVPNNPFGIFQDPSQNIFFGDTGNQMVRELVKSTDLVDFFAGDGTAGYGGDGGLAVDAEMNNPRTVARDSKGNIYIADESNQIIREVTTDNKIHTFAGTPGRCAFDGDGGPATSAFLCNPVGVFVDNNNNVYIADMSNHVVREVTNGIINTVAGVGGHCTYGGDGGPAIDAFLCNPDGVAVDPANNIYIADTSNCRVRKVSGLTGIITTLAGTEQCGFTGDGPANEVDLNSPNGVWVDSIGDVFIADTGNQRLRWVDPTGNLTTFAGNGNCGYTGDGIPALNTELCNPTGVFLEPTTGNYLVADQSNFRIRGVTAFAAAALSASSLSFGLQSVGTSSQPQVVTLGALGPLTITNIQVSGDFGESDDCPSSLTNGQTCAINVYFSPTASGTRTGAVTVNDNGFFNAAPQIQLTGTGTAIALSGVPVNFGAQLVNTTGATKTITVTNTGTSAITMGAITLNETKDFSMQSNTCPASGKTLAGGASCKIGVAFTPKSTGAKKGAVLINDNDPTSPQIAGVSGTGTSNVVLSPSSVNFGTQPVGVLGAIQTITLINNTGNTLALGNPALTVSADFVINKGKTTCTNNLQVASGGNCAIGIQFKPTVIGYRTGTLSVADNDSTSPQTAALSGIGISLGFTPASVNFGTVTHGQCSSQDTVTVANSGPAIVTFTGSDIVGPNSPDFREQNSTCGQTIAPGASCNILVQFCPTLTKQESATYELFDNSLGSPQKLPMTGKGQ